METLAGVVESLVFSSEDGRFSVFRVVPDGQSGRVTATVSSAPPLVGQQVELQGDWVEHPRFGSQFKATHIRVAAPTSAEGILRFLASGAVAGIGPAMAQRVVARFGEHALDVIENEPHKLLDVPGIGKKTAKKIHESYQEQSELKEVMLWLETHGVSGAYGARIYKQYGSFALDILEREPYRLASDVKGIGFRTADAIAMASGVEPDDPERIAAGIDYALEGVASAGHACVPEEWLLREASRALGVGREPVCDALRGAMESERLYCETVGGETMVYPPMLYAAETEVAERLRDLAARADVFSVDDPEILAREWERADGLTLSDGQRQAITAALRHGVFVLTGGPGTGKTTVVRGMIAVLEGLGLTVRLGAPTGRAAKRLGEATGRKASTVHRMLEAQGSDEEVVFARDEEEPLEADVIILDEVSMMDIVLMQHFLAAAPRGCHVILVGDVDQLPSVGPGAVLADILRSEALPCVRLTEIFRQADTSLIVRNAHAINAGRMPVCADGGAFEFRETASEEATAAEIVRLCAEELPAEGIDPLRDVQVLSPMHRLSCGIDRLNRLLQDALNPPAPYLAERAAGNFTYRVGDKVMQIRNDYEKGVFNGDVGFVEAMDEKKLLVRYGDELTAEYEREEMGELQPAYAMSVHKSQGSEYPVVLLPLVPGHHIMLQRNLLYTAVTRARERVILLGSRRALRAAVENDRTRRRYTLLAARLAGTLE
ncbi:MAG: ATP-dependent RecD-like DNA helicase [Schwartzia sp.]|nr:ATP-dependent RecD-like DNA helicase [Schwartzia sp. (in: firmicutes)]